MISFECLISLFYVNLKPMLCWIKRNFEDRLKTLLKKRVLISILNDYRQIPEELAGRGEVRLSLEDRRHDECPRAAPRHQAFSGKGHLLGRWVTRWQNLSYSAIEFKIIISSKKCEAMMWFFMYAMNTFNVLYAELNTCILCSCRNNNCNFSHMAFYDTFKR